MELKDKLFQLGGELKGKAEKLAKDAVDGSKKVAEKVKIKNAISQAESKLNAAYLEIGKKYEELYADSADEAFAELLAQVREAKASLEVSRADRAAVDSAVGCSGCGKGPENTGAAPTQTPQQRWGPSVTAFLANLRFLLHRERIWRWSDR